MSANTTGADNNALGYGALNANTTGGDNNAFGYNAMAANTTGDGNSAFGHVALDANTTADNNSAFGRNALTNCTTGYSNTAVGMNSAKDLTTGYMNVCIGAEAGQDLTTGDSNVFVGEDAGYSATTCENNVFIGKNAGQSITSGNSNVCIGKDAGDSLATGQDQCIHIGQNNNPGNATNNAICLGHDITIDGNYFAFGKASNIVYNNFTSDANWSRSSDSRLKTNVKDNTLGLSFIDSLRSVTFNWKRSQDLDPSDPHMATVYDADKNRMDSDKTMYGFIAQEVKAAMDSAGASEFGGWITPSTGIQGVSIEAMVVPLVKAVQELSAEIKKLKGEQ